MNSHSIRLYTSPEGKGSMTIRLLIGGFAAIVALLFGLLAFFVVPAPNSRTATEVAGILVSISRPHPEYGDIGIVLDNGQRYYINRANEVAHLDWEVMLAEVHPGDEIILTVVTPLAWRIFPDDAKSSQPVAGLRTADKVYMDAEIAATTWISQEKFGVIAIFSLIAFIVSLLPDFLRFFNQRAALNV